jgi:hypothetical protein
MRQSDVVWERKSISLENSDGIQIVLAFLRLKSAIVGVHLGLSKLQWFMRYYRRTLKIAARRRGEAIVFFRIHRLSSLNQEM